MSNSSLISATILSPNFTADRILDGKQYSIDTITPHCTAGRADSKCEDTARGFADPKRQASSNYTIGGDGRICLVVDEKDRSWCTGGFKTWAEHLKKRGNYEMGRNNDFHSVTIEIASDTTGKVVRQVAFDAFIKLSIDIMERNGKNKAVFIYTSDNNGEATVNYTPAANEMKFTWHRWFAEKACPGQYIMDHMQEAIDKINAHFAAAETPTAQTETPTTSEAPSTNENAVTNLIEKGDTVQINASKINDIINAVTTKLCGPLLVADLQASLATLTVDIQINTEDLTEVSNIPVVTACTPYIVKIQKVLPLNIYQEPAANAKIVSKINTAGSYTIVAQTTDLKYGKLKSGAGYIKLDDVTK